MTAPRRKVMLVVLDGFGTNPARSDNAVELARTPNLDRYFGRYPHTLIQASGHAVGLPDGQMGNSEVGHLTLGSGSIIRQDLVKIDDAIESGEFFELPLFLKACAQAREQNEPLHLLGLVSDGGVHSHIRHLLALIELAQQQQVVPLVHIVTDGRDTPPHSALDYLPPLQQALMAAGGAIASVCGRYYAMDRDKRWERTEKAWRLLMLGYGRKADSAKEAIEAAYSANESDEFIKPTILPAWRPLTAKTPLLFFNFRKDRPRQLIYALHNRDFAVFDRGTTPCPSIYCMMPYDRELPLPFAFEPDSARTSLGEVLSRAGVAQFHCAETEKFAHVTYFFNGGRQEPYQGEKRILIPSPKVATYDLMPQMSAARVADTMIETLQGGQYDFLLVNFANGDMVGHTAVRSAVIEAVETLDREVGRLLDVATELGYSVVVTADHGNCEEMVDPLTGGPQTQHTSFPVPLLVIDEHYWVLSSGAGLSSVAPTVLQLMGLAQPEEMEGESLLLRSRGVIQRHREGERLAGAA
ncbi:2,3-bisphosphoglycerate-independent phosphoglycerate mutase [Ectothiorhodospiraceae bacterium BW-2]|nr:2,3-bisphosphoglycerate-independent phosphoglycerate mutase [Ectothiorhodospiraceae bacterium BW-2]